MIFRFYSFAPGYVGEYKYNVVGIGLLVCLCSKQYKILYHALYKQICDGEHRTFPERGKGKISNGEQFPFFAPKLNFQVEQRHPAPPSQSAPDSKFKRYVLHGNRKGKAGGGGKNHDFS